jgi:hypothetical protein
MIAKGGEVPEFFRSEPRVVGDVRRQERALAGVETDIERIKTHLGLITRQQLQCVLKIPLITIRYKWIRPNEIALMAASTRELASSFL